MRFGIFLAYERNRSPEEYGDANLYDEILAQAKLAEEVGFEIIWVPEHHMIHVQQSPSAALAAVHLGLQVSCTIGTMVVLPTYRHPIITAGEIAMTDQILHGRFEVGLGRGAYKYEFERINVPFEEGKDRLAEAIDIFEEIWHSPDAGISFDGKFHTFDEAYVWPRPYIEPHPPVWIAGMTPPTIEWAAHKGYNVATWPFLRGMDVVEAAAATFHAGREAAGGVKGDQRLAVLRGTWVASTDVAAAEVTDEVLRNHRINQRLHHFTQNADPRGYVAPEEVEEEPSREQILQNMILGSPETCLQRVTAYHEIGVDDLLTSFVTGPSQEETLAAIRLFGEQVIAPFREQHGGAGQRPPRATASTVAN
jgi:alkanesulfonate monooxygenase SsuD/methylene tetrahydromethanopterin reductase-like flavin-dependent oxidoreductase (luciferase family)